MEFIKDLKAIIGKEVKTATMIDCDEKFVVVFTDGTYLGIEIGPNYGSPDLDFVSELDTSNQKEAGIISQEEYDEIKAKEQAGREERQKQNELATLERLKNKWEK